MKNSYNLVKTITLITLLAVGFATRAQQVANGPVKLQLRADAFWKGNYDDVLDNTEERDKIWFQDAANLDGQGWVGGNCFQWIGASGSGGFPMWSPPFNTIIFNNTYGTNVPQFFNIQLDGWEEDSGGDCDFDGPCSICFDPDDNRCGPTQVGGNIDFRLQGPPCVWNNTQIVPAGGGNCSNYGISFSSQYTPPVPTITGPTTGCGSITLTGNGAVWGGTYNWYNVPTGGSPLFTGATYTINTPGTTTLYLENQNACPSLGRSSYTVTVNATGNATFAYSAASYCKNGSNPTPTVATGGGTFTSAPSGLSINSSTGQINVATSTAGTYTITYNTGGACPGTQQHTVQIINADDATFNYSAPTYCQGGGTILPTITLNGGNFTSAPAGLAITGANGVVDLNTSQPGTYTITYVTAGACPATTTQQIVVTPSQDATFSYTNATYCQDSQNNPTPNLTGTPGGSYSSTPFGLVMDPNTGEIVLGSSLTGIPYTVTYTTPGPCTATQTFGVTIIDNPTAPTAASPAPICDGQPIPQLSAAGTGGTINWYDAASGGTLLQANSSVFNPAISGPGTYSYYVEEVGQISCASIRTQVNVVVNPIPAAPSVTPPAAICAGDAAPVLSASGSNVQFNWYNAPSGGTLLEGNNSNYTPTVGNAGTYFYYVEAVGPGNCTSTTRTQVALVVNALPLVAIATSDNSLCANEPAVPVFGFPQGVGGVLSGLGVSGSLFDPADLSGNIVVTYTFTDGNGCVNSANQSFVVYNVPQPFILTNGATVLCTGGDVTLDAGAGYQSYLWSDDQVSQTITVTESGVYTVSVVSTDGCVSDLSAPVTVQLVPDTFVAGPTLGNITVFCNGTPINTVLDAGAGWQVYQWNTSEFSQTINVTTPGIYSVTVTNALGCQFTDSVDVGFSTLSANIIANGPLLFCLGDTVQLSVNPAYSYSWSSGSTTQTIEVNHSGSYSVVVEDIYGCVATDTVDVTVEFPPVADFNYGQQTNSLDMNFYDFSMNGTSYSWTFGDNSAASSDQNPTHSFPNPGEYTVTLTVTNSCGTDVISLVVPVKTVGLPELAIENFSLYPNPTDGNLQIRFNSTVTQAIDIRVMNTVGQLLFNDAVNGFTGTYQKSYDLSSLPSGVYLFQIVTERGSRTERVIVQH